MVEGVAPCVSISFRDVHVRSAMMGGRSKPENQWVDAPLFMRMGGQNYVDGRHNIRTDRSEVKKVKTTPGKVHQYDRM